jgi:putative membrane protein
LAIALHIIAVIALVASLLMTPRFYSYIAGAQPGGELETKMLAAALRLRVIIMNPALIAVWLLGLYLLIAFNVGSLGRPLPQIIASVPGWFWMKLVLVLALSGYHGFLIGAGKRLAKGERRHSEKFWRAMSEIPFLITIAVVLLAVLKPF